MAGKRESENEMRELGSSEAAAPVNCASIDPQQPGGFFLPEPEGRKETAVLLFLLPTCKVRSV